MNSDNSLDEIDIDPITEAIRNIEKLENGDSTDDNSDSVKKDDDKVTPTSNDEDVEPTTINTDDDNDEAQEEEEVILPPKRPEWKVKKDYYKVKAEKEYLTQEVDYLKQQLNESLNAGTYHYARTAYSDLDKAKLNQKLALENGDINAFTEASVELNRAVFAINELEKLANKSNAQSSYYPNSAYQQHSGDDQLVQQKSAEGDYYQDIASDWLESHPYLKPNSRNYNEKLAIKVDKFVNKLNNDLVANNQQQAYFSEQYFDVIDNFIDKSKTESRPKTSLGATIGGVRNSYSGNVASKNRAASSISLTDDEKIIARNLDLTEDQYLHHKKKSNKNR